MRKRAVTLEVQRLLRAALLTDGAETDTKTKLTTMVETWIDEQLKKLVVDLCAFKGEGRFDVVKHVRFED